VTELPHSPVASLILSRDHVVVESRTTSADSTCIEIFDEVAVGICRYGSTVECISGDPGEVVDADMNAEAHFVSRDQLREFRFYEFFRHDGEIYTVQRINPFLFLDFDLN
jgi:hypothetical protein